MNCQLAPPSSVLNTEPTLLLTSQPVVALLKLTCVSSLTTKLVSLHVTPPSLVFSRYFGFCTAKPFWLSRKSIEVISVPIGADVLVQLCPASTLRRMVPPPHTATAVCASGKSMSYTTVLIPVEKRSQVKPASVLRAIAPSPPTPQMLPSGAFRSFCIVNAVRGRRLQLSPPSLVRRMIPVFVDTIPVTASEKMMLSPRKGVVRRIFACDVQVCPPSLVFSNAPFPPTIQPCWASTNVASRNSFPSVSGFSHCHWADAGAAVKRKRHIAMKGKSVRSDFIGKPWNH